MTTNHKLLILLTNNHEKKTACKKNEHGYIYYTHESALH